MEVLTFYDNCVRVKEETDFLIHPDLAIEEISQTMSTVYSIACQKGGVQYEELHTPTIVATAWAFTVVRFAVGFFVFGLAFDLRRGSQPAWMYGAAVAAYERGATILRVHDVREHVEALTAARAVYA